MKLKYAFIPTILLTILIIGICKNYYNHDLLSMDQVCMIAITSFIALFTIFFGIYALAYQASESVAERQNIHIDQLSRFIAQHINECFKAHDELTKDVITQQLVKVVETMKELALTLNEGDDKRAKVLNNLLVDIKQLSITTRDNVLIAKTSALNTEKLAEESMERLDNVLICLRKDEVKEKDVEAAIEKLYGVLTNLKTDEILIDEEDVEENGIKIIGE